MQRHPDQHYADLERTQPQDWPPTPPKDTNHARVDPSPLTQRTATMSTDTAPAADRPSAQKPGESAAAHEERLVSVLTHLGDVARAQAGKDAEHADEKADYRAWQSAHDADVAARRRAGP